MNISFSMFGKMFGFNVQDVPPLYTVGISNETDDGYFLPFLDMDGIYFDALVRYVRMAQREYNLSPAIVLCSSGAGIDEVGGAFGNYMVIMLDKLKYHDLIDVLRFLPVDELSIKMPRYHRYKSWVLRMIDKTDSTGKVIVKKPEFVDVVYPEKRSRNQSSNAHYTFLKRLYGFRDFSADLNLDSLYGLTTVRYNTKGKVSEELKNLKYEYLSGGWKEGIEQQSAPQRGRTNSSIPSLIKHDK